MACCQTLETWLCEVPYLWISSSFQNPPRMASRYNISTPTCNRTGVKVCENLQLSTLVLASPRLGINNYSHCNRPFPLITSVSTASPECPWFDPWSSTSKEYRAEMDARSSMKSAYESVWVLFFLRKGTFICICILHVHVDRRLKWMLSWRCLVSLVALFAQMDFK